MNDPAPLPRCLNCGQALADPRPRFCGQCGQETSLRPPRFFEFVQQFGGAYFSTEGALWRTLGLLLFRPGELTRRYLAGRRKHYVLPLRLYLTLSLLALVVLRLQIPSDLKLGAEAAAEGGKLPQVTILQTRPDNGAGIKDGVFYCKELPEWLCSRLKRRLDVDAKSFEREVQRLPERFVSQWGTAMFLLLPFFAVLHKIVYWGRGLRYTEHLVYALHVHAFWFAALALSTIPWPWVAGTLALVVPGYTLIAARRVYGGGWIATLAKALLVATVYGVVLGVAVALVLLLVFLS